MSESEWYSDTVSFDYYTERQSGIQGACPRLQAIWTQVLGHRFPHSEVAEISNQISWNAPAEIRTQVRLLMSALVMLYHREYDSSKNH